MSGEQTSARTCCCPVQDTYSSSRGLRRGLAFLSRADDGYPISSAQTRDKHQRDKAASTSATDPRRATLRDSATLPPCPLLCRSLRAPDGSNEILRVVDRLLKRRPPCSKEPPMINAWILPARRNPRGLPRPACLENHPEISVYSWPR